MLCELGLVAAILLTAADVRPAASELPFHVIVNRSNAVSSLSKAEVSAIFMRRTRSWKGGAEIVPVQPPPTAALRREFTRAIHGTTVAFVTRYWQRLIFAGRSIPPLELPDDDDVIAFVRKTPGAIGYVQRLPDDDVKTIAVTP